MNQVFFGLGKTWRNTISLRNNNQNSFSIGFNAGYEWGTKFISTKIDFPSDSAMKIGIVPIQQIPHISGEYF